MKNFADRLTEAVLEKGTPICVGLDPILDKIPDFIKEKALEEFRGNKLKAAAESIIAFNKGLINSFHDLVAVVKPQIAFYEMLGSEGYRAFEETCAYAKAKGLMVIADAKRGDLGSTSDAYADEFIGEVEVYGEEIKVHGADALTVNPYMGWDAVSPYIPRMEKYGTGLFLLVKTSNPSSGDLQDLLMNDGRSVYEILAHYVESWGANLIGDSGFSAIGAVVGATYPQEIKKIREIMPETIFLIPGYGAQGAGAEDVAGAFVDGKGALINSSRAINFAYLEDDKYKPVNFMDAARDAVLEMKKDLSDYIA